MTDAATFSRINRVMSVYHDLYDARAEGSTERRDLETHEALFLSAVGCIRREARETLHEGQKVWGYHSNAYEALANLTYRNEAYKLEAALANYKRECERFENGEVEQAADAANHSRGAVMAKTCDIKCMDLAEHFTADHADEYSEHDLHELAWEIQQAVEDWFADRARAKAGIDA